MPQQLIEGIVDRLLEYYRENLPLKLHAIALEHSDGIELKAPESNCYYVGELQLAGNSPDYPKLFIFGEQTRVNFYTPSSTDADHELQIMAAIKSTDTGPLRRAMYRYGRALWELTVERFFTVTGDDYFALHGEGDITTEYEGPPADQVTGPYIGKVTLRAAFSKQEDVS